MSATGTAISVQPGSRRAALRLARGDEPLAEIEVQVDEPAWLGPTTQRVAELLDLPDNWDSYGGRPIDRAAVARALQFLGKVMQPATPPPTIIPTSHGSVELEWHTRGVDLEVRPLPSGGASVYCEDQRSGEQWEAELGADLSRLERVLVELARAATWIVPPPAP